MLTPEEQQIVEYGKTKGRSETEVLNALSKYRKEQSAFTPSMVNEDSRLKDIPSDIAETGSGIKGVIQKRGVKQREILDANAKGEQGFLSTVGQSATNLASSVMEVGGEVLKGGIKLFTKPSTEKKVSENLQSVGNKVMSAPEVQQWMQNLNDLKKSNPEMARNLIATMEGGAFLLEFAGLKGAKAGFDAAETGLKTGLRQGKELVETGAEKVTQGFKNTATKVKTLVTDTAETLKNKGKEVAGFKPKNPLTTAYDAVTPSARELTPTEYSDLLRKGKISPKTATQEASYILSKQEKEIAQKFANLLQSGDSVKNGQNIINEIIRLDDEVGKYLSTKSTSIWSKKKFEGHLLDTLKDIDDVTVPSSRLNKAKQELVKSFVENLPKNATLKDLWEARKAFDGAIETKLRAFSGSPTLKKDMAKALRNSIQDFIAESTDEGVYKSFMKDMSQLYDLADIVDMKAVKEKGQSAIQAWIKQNPQKAKAAKWALGIIGASAVGSVVF